METLKLTQASAIIDTAIAEGRKKDLAPLAVAVLDPHGHVIAFKREDEASFDHFNIAYGKAWGALGAGFSVRDIAERATEFPTSVAVLSAASQGRMFPSPGGMLIVDAEDEVMGAVGVSGDSSDHNEECTIAGIKGAGLSTILKVRG